MEVTSNLNEILAKQQARKDPFGFADAVNLDLAHRFDEAVDLVESYQATARDMLDENGDPLDYQEYDEMRTSFGWEALDVLEDLLLAAGLIEVEERT